MYSGGDVRMQRHLRNGDLAAPQTRAPRAKTFAGICSRFLQLRRSFNATHRSTVESARGTGKTAPASFLNEDSRDLPSPKHPIV